MTGFTVEIRNKLVNKLLERIQLLFEVYHPTSEAPTRIELQEYFGEHFKLSKECVFIYGVETAIGGFRTKGFAKIYDTVSAGTKFETSYMLIEHGLKEKETKLPRKQRKERKNKAKRIWGRKKAVLFQTKKK